MFSYENLQDFFQNQKFKTFIIASDGETRVHKIKNGKIQEQIPAGGVSIALDPIARAARAIYIARGKNEEEKTVLDNRGKITIKNPLGDYTLKRIFVNKEDLDAYYYGFSNQTLWPLCHITFERPEFKKDWYEGFKRVNQQYARAIKEEIKGKTFIWINDYQLSLVPSYLGKQKDVTVGLFWHIPWPTWEIFRILPNKQELLQSLLLCDFIGFHRGYQARNFLQTLERELEARIDRETNKVYFNKNTTTVQNLPMGIDTDVIRSLAVSQFQEPLLTKLVKSIIPQPVKGENSKEEQFRDYFKKYKVLLGVDRLDYTKGLILRLLAIDRFFENNKAYIGKVMYFGIVAPSREPIPAYQALKKEIKELAFAINEKYKRSNWKPIEFIYEVFTREDIISFYENAAVCLVTPRDDGMNLVSKEFVLASSLSENPGMLVLSQFAGSAMDLTESLIINPYNTDEVAAAIKKGLEMSKSEKTRRIKTMVETLDEKNVYEWAHQFVKSTISAAK